MDSLSALARLADVADGQFGYVTTAQAAASLDAEHMAALLEADLVEQVTPQVVRVRAGGRHRFPELYAAWLALQPEVPAWRRDPPGCGVVSHGSALRLYQVGDQPGPAVEFTVPRAGGAGDQVAAHVAVLEPDDWQDLAGMPVTTPARTMLDMAARLDGRELARLADVLIAHGWANSSRLTAALEEQLRRPSVPDDARSLLSSAVLDRLG